MGTERHFSLLDHLLVGIDRGRRRATGIATQPARPSPASEASTTELSPEQKRHAAGLMRINHTGEVCAQALYQGQAMTAKLGNVRERMQEAADEEADHLAWCAERIAELDGETSRLNPLFYSLSLGLGALAGTLGDRWSLGFVAATEEQVCEHLRDHLEQLPDGDERSRAILEQMLIDEERHGSGALDAGGIDYAPPVKAAMTLVSKLMTATTYRV